MPTYNTVHVKNISTGEPIIFDVTVEKLKRLELQRQMVNEGRAPLLGSSDEELVQNFEFSLFPAYKDLLKIFVRNGFSIELITKILQDFGADEKFVRELLANKGFISGVSQWFSGITCDGGRVIRTLGIVYSTALSYWKRGAVTVPSQEKPTEMSLLGEG